VIKGLVFRIRSAAAAFLRPGRPYVPKPAMVTGLARARIDPTARIIAEGSVILGDNVYLGRFVEIATTTEGLFTIGDDTSIQDYAVMIGDIRIGAHCIFAPNVHVASHNHHFRDKPQWLIRDQDERFAETKTAPVVIEDDCWIGRNVVIAPGVYVGRGAVIGANSVVSRDVSPYEVHGGVPNQRIQRRLDFSPPQRIDAMDDACLPYFYRGFLLSQRKLAASRALGVVETSGQACLITPRRGKVRITGKRLGERPLTLSLCVNGTPSGEWTVEGREFAIEAQIPTDHAESVPATLRSHGYVELSATSAYGVSSVSVA
jgi:acetyltransferase-like isoleucine patch superfamily enzyme